jgi:hypothetical protein
LYLDQYRDDISLVKLHYRSEREGYPGLIGNAKIGGYQGRGDETFAAARKVGVNAVAAPKDYVPPTVAELATGNVKKWNLGYDRLVIVGYSWGGAAAIEFAKRLATKKIYADLIFLIDPVSKPFPNHKLPARKTFAGPNTKVISFYQDSDNKTLPLIPALKNPFTAGAKALGLMKGDPRLLPVDSIHGSEVVGADNKDQYYSAERIQKELPKTFFAEGKEKLEQGELTEEQRKNAAAYGHLFMPYMTGIRESWRLALAPLLNQSIRWTDGVAPKDAKRLKPEGR